MRSLVMMIGISIALAVSAVRAAERDVPDDALPQPMLADEPATVLAMGCSVYRLLRLQVAERELETTIRRLRDRRQTAQVRRVLAQRLRERVQVMAALEDVSCPRS